MPKKPGICGSVLNKGCSHICIVKVWARPFVHNQGIPNTPRYVVFQHPLGGSNKSIRYAYEKFPTIRWRSESPFCEGGAKIAILPGRQRRQSSIPPPEVRVRAHDNVDSFADINGGDLSRRADRCSLDIDILTA